MSTTITLYQGTELNNKYQDVFRSRALLEEYLSGFTQSTITLDIYFKMTGSFNLPVTKYDEVPNYIKAVDNNTGNVSYYFVNSYENYNGIFKIGYMIDVWHTYIDILKVGPGTRNRSSTILGSYADLPYYMHLNSRQTFNIDSIGVSNPNSPSDIYYLFATGYYYQGATSYSGIPSRATSFMTVAKDSSGADKQFSFQDAMEEAPVMMQAFASATNSFSVPGTNAFYIQITNIWIVPYNALKPLDFSFSVLQKLTKPYDWNTEETSSGYTYAIEDANEIYWPVLGGGYMTGNATAVSFKSPFFPKSETLSHTEHQVVKSIGIGKEAMPIPSRIYKDNQNIGIQMLIGISGLAYNLQLDDVCVDLAQNWEVSINFTPETAQTAQGRQANAIQGAISKVTGMVAGTASAAVSGNPMQIAGALVSDVSTIAQMAVDFINPTKSTVSSESSCIDPYEHIYWDCVAVSYYVQNYADVNNAYRLCGLEVCYPTSGDNLTDGTDYDYNVIGYSQVKIDGAIPEQYKQAIEQILVNGVRVWQKAYTSLNPLSANLSNPPSEIEI